MKVTIIDGSPEELAEYEALTGLIGPSQAVVHEPRPEEAAPVDDGQPVSATGFEDEMMLRAFIFGRARTPVIGGRVERYIHQVLGLGGVEVEIGTSKTSKDGRTDYLRIYNAGPRHYGAVAYVNAKNAGLSLRLTKDDVHDLAMPSVNSATSSRATAIR